MLIDIHTHLDHEYFDKDRDEALQRAKAANVKVILSAGTDPKSNRAVLELAKKYDILKPCLGIYPVEELPKEGKEIKKAFSFSIEDELEFIRKNKNKIAAIAEIGLDYHWTTQFVAEQKELFQKMIDLSEAIGKPMVIHSRKAEEDCIAMLKSSSNKKIIMHCFGGKKALARQIVDNGWFLTAPTSITRSSQFQEQVKMTPITQLFCETDAPYLSPFKDQRNEPAFIVEAYQKVAEIKNMEFEEVVNNIWMNYQRIFG